MHIEQDQDELGDLEEYSHFSIWCCCCKQEISNPDLVRTKKRTLDESLANKEPYFETGYLIPHNKKQWVHHTLTMEYLRYKSEATRGLSSPWEAIKKNNKKYVENQSVSQAADLNIGDINNLLRRRLSLRVLVSEEDESGERGEAVMAPKNFSKAAPILLSHLVESSALHERRKSSVSFIGRLRKSLTRQDIRHSTEDLLSLVDENENSDQEFIDNLAKTSQFMQSALEKDWPKTKNYIKWLESHIQSSDFSGQVTSFTEKWMVVLYTSSADSNDQLSNFRCMLVRLILQHHCIVYEERDVILPQYEVEFRERLMNDMENVPQVFMHGFNVGGYRVIYGIHRLRLIKSIFGKFVLSPEGYAEWMFNRHNKENQLSLEVNLKAFPALQSLAGSWANDHLSPAHLEFVNMGKFVVKLARERWYSLSKRPFGVQDLRRYALLRLTIIYALIAMNKVYKQYLNKIEPESTAKLRRKLSWLPRFSRQASKD